MYKQGLFLQVHIVLHFWMVGVYIKCFQVVKLNFLQSSWHQIVSESFLTAVTVFALWILRDIKNLRKIPSTYYQYLVVVSLEPDKVVDDLHPTEDGEASEKAHGASYQAQLSLSGHLKWRKKLNLVS